MKYIKLTCVFLFSIQIYTAFSQSNADYFPWKTGDMWEYILYYWPDIDTLQSIVIDDSIDETGNIYTTYFSRAINPIQPPSALIQDTIVYKIDSSLYVYHRYFDFNNGEWINVYRLNGNSGDQWVMWDYSHSGVGPFEIAKIDSIKEYNLFGQNTKMMYMSYFWASVDGTDTLKLYRYYDQLVKGFGFYFRGGAELNAQLYLRGCVIDGVLYGDTTQIVTSVDELQRYSYFINDFALLPNYPNPFNSSTNIRFEIREYSFVSIKVYNITGKEIKTLLEKELAPGNYLISWEAKDEKNYSPPSGIYFIKLNAGSFNKTIKAVLLK
ncbi:MAG: T9SS type A sorting domain-containing protein [Ignavibacterium sp.]